MSRRTRVVAAALVCCLLLSACGGESTVAVDTSAAATKGVVDKTGASSAASGTSSGSSTTSKAAAGKKLAGSVCQLLTAAEVEAVVKSTQTITPSENPGDREIERSCSYIVAQAAPILVLSLKGELEPPDIAGLKTAPGSKSVAVRGGEAVWVGMVNVLAVHKNGLQVNIQLVVAPDGETFESASTKLAQQVVDRLP